MDAWVEHELTHGTVPDHRLKTRLGRLITDLSQRIGSTLPMVCQDWAATKAAYRFFCNPRIDDQTILAGHFAATQARFAATTGPILVLHDTTKFSDQRSTPKEIGWHSFVKGRHVAHTVCGLLMHSSLVLDTTGVPLGLAAVKFWSRQQFKGTAARKKRINPTREPIQQKESMRWLDNLSVSSQRLGEPSRCVHIGDREADIFELFCVAQDAQTHFVIRRSVDRLAGQGHTTIDKKMRRQPIRGTHTIEVRDEHGHVSKAKLHVRFGSMTVHPPVAKQKQYSPQNLSVIHVHERGHPAGREPIAWKLMTNCPVDDLASAIEKLDWYAMRWKLETFHKVLKSGCQAEQSKLRTLARLSNLLALLLVVGWRVFWLTMVNRSQPDAPAETVLTPPEIDLLDQISGERPAASKRTVSHYLLAIAKLGGYLARNNDPPPGNVVLWRGLSRLADILQGYTLKQSSYG